MSNLTDKAIKKLREQYDIEDDIYLSGHVMHNWDESCGCDGGYFDVPGGHSMACDCHSTYLMLVTDDITPILDKDGKKIVVDFDKTKTYASRIKDEKADKKAKKKKKTMKL